MKLVIGNKNYSSWSLRPWLLLSHFNIPFEEAPVSLRAENLNGHLRQYSPSCRVPVLVDGPLTVWDSLAICEYVSEKYLAGRGWPSKEASRALARSVSAEMHSSFMALRGEMPMNCRARRKLEPSSQAHKDIQRIDSIWSEYLVKDQDGPWLFGDFSIADCMFAPVVLRFETYGVAVSDISRRYMQTMLTHEPLMTWLSDASKEDEVLPANEAGMEVD